ncbi:phage portal protein [Clostridium sp.]|uniref:phage portal protein n=1 Tax=Clostridium sp. TaxID=1506 RepID=UPI0028FFE675|nr:phage portal protein [Clostridium sp.]MDU7260729.1 phage portal protein [Clostridium butyricum]MDU1068181.1 phage portal protein [Clostridium sp.]MDU2679755.1 phage portal protein [Clostridium sp.]MDU4211936.1 phage portal protein [Clostridium sp.]MDU5175095.1 phage portal protein [Clostridium sp.]
MLYNKDIALKMYGEYNKNKSLYKKMYDYYIGETDVLKSYPETDRSNRKIVDNFIKTFIDEEVSFMAGMPITYSSKDEQTGVINDVEYNLNNINASLDTQLATNLLIFGEAYEFYYKNNDEFKIKCFNPLNSYAYVNTENEVELFMYFYKKDLDDNTYIEVVDDKFIYHFNESFTEIAEATPHYFNRCPVGISNLVNGHKDTLFHNIKHLQDNYELCMSDWSNEIGDTRLAYLVLTGVDLEEETAKKMKEMGILQIKDAKGKADWLIKNINSDFVKQYREILKEDIYRVAQHIDNQTNIQSNTSGTMLATRMNCLRIKITTQNQALKNCIKTRLKCLFRFLELTENKSYDYRNIDIRPQLNLPSNDVETAQIISQLNGKLSIATGLERLSFITNGKAEFEKMLAEQKQINDNDMSSVSDLGDINE